MTEWQRILVAIDEEDTSVRALRYVGDIARHLDDYTICLLHVYPPPPPDHNVQGVSLDAYRRTEEYRSREIIARATVILREYGLDLSRVDGKTLMADGCTISDVVLAVQKEGRFGTVVVGKRGVSKAEEFLFGSISNTLARHSRHFCAWIVG